jgi:hypothetical protein
MAKPLLVGYDARAVLARGTEAGLEALIDERAGAIG